MCADFNEATVSKKYQTELFEGDLLIISISSDFDKKIKEAQRLEYWKKLKKIKLYSIKKKKEKWHHLHMANSRRHTVSN